MTGTIAPPTARAVSFLVKHARTEILRVARPDSCIFSTRVAVMFCKELGITARAMSVRAAVFNSALVERYDRQTVTNGLPPTAQEMKAWQHEPGAACWSVGVGYGDAKPGAFAGHLVAIVEDRFLLDLSIDQADRPERGIVLEPLWIERVEPGLLRGSSPQVMRNSVGCALRYERHDNDSWMGSPDWTERDRWDGLVRGLVERFKREDPS